MHDLYHVPNYYILENTFNLLNSKGESQSPQRSVLQLQWRARGYSP